MVGGRTGWAMPAGISLLAVVALVAMAMLATGSASPAVAFAQTGHWVFNQAESTLTHVDGGTHQVDARVAVPNAPQRPLFTVQGEKQGFLVSSESITTFGKSTLTVEGSIPAAGPDLPVGIEVVGGPYLVYRQTGVVVRLGDPPLTVHVGGAVDRPTATDDGTVWLHRPDTGAVCALRRDSATLDCPRSTAPSLPGALAVTATAAAYVDTRDDTGQVVDGSGPDVATRLGTELRDTPLVADRDTRGRLPAVVPALHVLVLVDSAGISTGVPGGAPVTIDLGPGDFSAPMASDGVVAVVDETHRRLVTFDITGRQLASADLPLDGTASLTRGGDGRIYVDGADGVATFVVGSDGTVTEVRTGGQLVAAVGAPSPALALPTPPPVSREVTVTTSGGSTQDPRPEPPPVPVGVEAHLAATGVVVSWSSVNAPSVRYTVAGSGTRPISTSGTSATIGGLAPGTTYTFTVTATNGSGTSRPSAPASITLPDALRITTNTMPAATVGQQLTVELAATGGTAPYRWSIARGSLPSGISLSPEGTLSGSPTKPGSANFAVRVTDSAGQTASQALNLAPVLLIGDINHDGHVACIDLNILLDDYNQTGPNLRSDINHDGTVNLADTSILLSHWGEGGGDGSTCQRP